MTSAPFWLSEAARWVLTLLLLLYFAGWLLALLDRAAVIVQPNRVPPSQYPHIDRMLRVEQGKGERRRQFAALLLSPTTSLNWPVGLWRISPFLRRKSDLHYAARLALAPTHVMYAASSFAVLAVVALLTRLQLLQPQVAWWTVVLLLVSTTVRHVGYLLLNLPEQLRAARWNRTSASSRLPRWTPRP